MKTSIMNSGIFSRRNQLVFAVLFSSLIVILYYLYFNHFQVTYPLHEDSHMATFVTQWDNMSWAQRIDEFGKFTFGHRYYYARTISILYAKTHHGMLDLRDIMLCGIIISVFFVFVFAWLFRRSGISEIYLIPIVLLLFNPQLRDYIFWALTNQLYPPSLLFSLIAIILVTKPGYARLALAVVCGLIATGSFSSGLLVFPSVLIVLIMRRHIPSVLIWLVVTAVTYALYFRNYNEPGWGWPAIYVADPKFTLYYRALYFFINSGNTILLEPGQVNATTIHNRIFWPPLCLGLLCWFTLGYGIAVSWLGGIVSKFTKKSSPALSGLFQKQFDWFERHPQSRLFLTAASALLAVTLYMIISGRASTIDGYQIFERRLKLYPVVIQILAYSMVVTLATIGGYRRPVFVACVSFAGLVSAYSYFHLIYNTNVESKNLRVSIQNYTHNKHSYLADYGTWGGNVQRSGKSHYEPAQRSGKFPLEHVDLMANAALSQDTLLLPFVRKSEGPGGNYDVSISAATIKEQDLNNYYVLLRNSEYQFVVAMNPRRNGVVQFVKTGKYYIGEPTGGILRLTLPDGQYQIGLLKAGSTPVYRYQSDSINVERKEAELW